MEAEALLNLLARELDKTHPCAAGSPREGMAETLNVMAGYDAGRASEPTRLTNRLHDALLHVHRALERSRIRYCA